MSNVKENRKCKDCGEYKPLSEFPTLEKYCRNRCNACLKEKTRQYWAEYSAKRTGSKPPEWKYQNVEILGLGLWCQPADRAINLRG